jgi:hypothetical protein
MLLHCHIPPGQKFNYCQDSLLIYLHNLTLVARPVGETFLTGALTSNVITVF